MNKEHLDRVAVYYHSVLHASDFSYQPNSSWDDQTLDLLGLLESNIPEGSTITEIGSGAGKWLCLLSQHCSNLIGIEPNDYLRNTCTKVVSQLHLKNITVVDNHMPKCIGSITSEVVLLMGSIYLNDWRLVYDSLLDNTLVQTIIVFDGPDTERTQFNTSWTTSFNGLRRPLLSGDELTMSQMATERNWITTLIPKANEWLLIAKRK